MMINLKYLWSLLTPLRKRFYCKAQKNGPLTHAKRWTNWLEFHNPFSSVKKTLIFKWKVLISSLLAWTRKFNLSITLRSILRLKKCYLFAHAVCVAFFLDFMLCRWKMRPSCILKGEKIAIESGCNCLRTFCWQLEMFTDKAVLPDANVNYIHWYILQIL